MATATQPRAVQPPRRKVCVVTIPANLIRFRRRVSETPRPWAKIGAASNVTMIGDRVGVGRSNSARAELAIEKAE